ncbi:MAG: replication factor C large subunit [Ignisphaera sp.]|uniref:Replication factor C large subunit n=1 Tax=Ignisphaera aggregans TaxID=334771 RepID=A0A7C4JLL2_9CREN
MLLLSIVAGDPSTEKKIPWIIKYRPKQVNEVVNQEQAKQRILEWLKRWPNVEKKALLLYGPPGVGKTSLVEAIANELGYDLIELNASDNRKREDIDRIVVRTSLTKSLATQSTKKIVLLDEVDGVADKDDAGGLEAIKKLVELTAVPIIMTANNPWNQKLRSLREISEMIQFKKLTKNEMIYLLRQICSKEKIECANDVLEYIVERSEGDLRSAINDLEVLYEGRSKVLLQEAKAILRPRDREHDPFETLRLLFSANYAWQAKSVLNQSQLDYDQLKLWLEENIVHQYQDPEDMARAYEALSRADIYLGRILKTGEWDLLSYSIDIMTAGVSLAAKNNTKDKYRWIKYSFPQRLTLASKSKEIRSILDDISKIISLKLHVSTSTAKNDIIPLLRAISINNPQIATRISMWLGFSEKMLELISGPNKSHVIEQYKQLKKLLQQRYNTIHEKKEKEPRSPIKPSNETSKKPEKESKSLLSFAKK